MADLDPPPPPDEPVGNVFPISGSQDEDDLRRVRRTQDSYWDRQGRRWKWTHKGWRLARRAK